jgi:hypothetical protein
MASSNVLSGLYKWLSREEWQEPFQEMLERHLGEPCAAAGITLDGLARAVGDHHATVLFGCVVEDFAASDLEDGSNIIDDYLKRRGWRESVPNKRYLTGLRASVMSLYEVSDIVRDQSFLARDLLRGGEPVRVSEKSATHSLKPWDRLAARIVRVGPKLELAGGGLPFPHDVGERLRKGFAKLKKEIGADALELARDRHRRADVDERMVDTEILRRAGYLFTNFWLDDALQRVLDPQLPKLVNSDGDEIAFTTVRYPLKPAVDRAALESALSAIAGFHRADGNVWNWSAPASSKVARAPEGVQVLATSFEDGSVSIGHVELGADALELETSSPQRARKGRALLDPVIGPFVGEPVVKSQTMEELRASPPADRAPALSSGLSPEEESAIVQEALERHYRGLLDEPVPMLGNLTPRKAAKTKKGREKLVGWLKLLENSVAREKAGSPMAGYNLRWMWEELGIIDLRH